MPWGGPCTQGRWRHAARCLRRRGATPLVACHATDHPPPCHSVPCCSGGDTLRLMVFHDDCEGMAAASAHLEAAGIPHTAGAPACAAACCCWRPCVPPSPAGPARLCPATVEAPVHDAAGVLAAAEAAGALGLTDVVFVASLVRGVMLRCGLQALRAVLVSKTGQCCGRADGQPTPLPPPSAERVLPPGRGRVPAGLGRPSGPPRHSDP